MKTQPNYILGGIAIAVICSGAVGGFAYWKYQKEYRLLHGQIVALQHEVSAQAVTPAEKTYATSQQTWQGFGSSLYSFQYPTNATLLDPGTGTFLFNNTIYQISVLQNSQVNSISAWITGGNLGLSSKLSDYTSTVVNGFHAYTLNSGLMTAFMAGPNIYLISGKSGNTISTAIGDPAYARLLATLKINLTS